MNFLDRFVTARFWLAPAFVTLYYAQFNLLLRFPIPRRVCLAALMGTLVIALAANLRWIPDYRARLCGGLAFLRRNKDSLRDDRQILEQMRWANAKILAIIAMILALLAHYEKLENLHAHTVPALIVVLLVLVALFDSALDLEAEWTISVLFAPNSAGSSAPKLQLAHTIWNTNQFRKAQTDLYEGAIQGKHTKIIFRAFSATAQNLISFAIIIVGGTAAVALRLLYLQW